MRKFSNHPHHIHMPHLDVAELILLGVIVVSIVVALGADCVYRALVS